MSICIVVNMYQDLLKLRRIMYLDITESEMLPHHGMFIHLVIVSLAEEWHAMPLITAGRRCGW